MFQYSYNSKQHVKGEIIALDKSYPRDSGWTWFNLQDDEGEVYHISGVTNVYLMVGLKLECDVIPDKVYKGQQQYRLNSHIQCNLLSRHDIVRYLSSNAFSHIGFRTAEKLYDVYGADIFDKVKDDLQDVITTCKLSQEQADSLYAGIVQESVEGMLQRLLPSLSDVIIRKIAKIHQSDMKDFVDTVQRNPYVLLNYNVSFRQVDNVVLNDLHWRCDNEMRMEHVFNYTLSKHIVSEYDEYGRLRERSTKSIYLNLSKDFIYYFNYVCCGANAFRMPDGVDSNWFYNQLEKILSKSYMLKKISHFNRTTKQIEYHLYDIEMYRSKLYLENFAVNEAKGLGTANLLFQMALPKRLNNYQKWLSIGNFNYSRLNSGQQVALRNTIKNRVSFVTGGPGRGKTTFVRTLIDAWSFVTNGDGDVVLLAPTGKAVKKLKDDTNYGECQTVARFVLMNTMFELDDNELVLMDGLTTCKNSLNTLVVVDETSMLNYNEAAQLLSLIDNCTIVFLGDVNQLAPIEPGCFLSDIQAMNIFTFSVLTQNMRTNVAVLSDNNDKILNGTLSPKDYDVHFGFDFTLVNDDTCDARNAADALSCDKAIRYYQDALQRGYDSSQILLLSPARKGTNLGVNILNVKLQNLINPLFTGDINQYKVRDNNGSYCLIHKGFECPSVILGETNVRIMDRVMNTKNDTKCEWKKYENDVYGSNIVEEGTGVFNGDVGTIERYILPTVRTNAQIVVHMDDGRYFTLDVSDFKSSFVVAYATTVHKAQGSEAPIVIVALSEASTFYRDGFLTKNLLYTATTRAKEEVQIVGSRTAFDICLATEQVIDESTLCEDVAAKIA